MSVGTDDPALRQLLDSMVVEIANAEASLLADFEAALKRAEAANQELQRQANDTRLTLQAAHAEITTLNRRIDHLLSRHEGAQTTAALDALRQELASTSAKQNAAIAKLSAQVTTAIAQRPAAPAVKPPTYEMTVAARQLAADHIHHRARG